MANLVSGVGRNRGSEPSSRSMMHLFLSASDSGYDVTSHFHGCHLGVCAVMDCNSDFLSLNIPFLLYVDILHLILSKRPRRDLC